LNHKRLCKLKLATQISHSTQTGLGSYRKTTSIWAKSTRRSGICTVRPSNHLWTRRWCGRSWTWSVMSWQWRCGARMIRSSSTSRERPSWRSSWLKLTIRSNSVLVMPRPKMKRSRRRNLWLASSLLSSQLNPNLIHPPEAKPRRNHPRS